MKKNLLLILFVCTQGLSAQYLIGTRSITYVDSSRSNRNIPIEIFYPAETAGANTFPVLGLYPVITFGHGFVMGVDAYYNFRDTLVPKGYVIVLVNTETSFSPVHLDYATDLLFINNKIRSLCANDPGFFLYPFFNGKTCIMGHSMGGGSSVLSGSLAQPGDVNCIAGFAPSETTPSAIAASGSYNLPLIIFSGSADGVTPPAQHHIPMYDSSASNCKFFVDITGGAHCYFANTNIACDFGESVSSSGISITREEQQATTFKLLQLWLRFYLQNDNNGLNNLYTDLQNSATTNYQSSCGTIGIEEQGNWSTNIHWELNDHILTIQYLNSIKGMSLSYNIQNLLGQSLYKDSESLKEGEKVQIPMTSVNSGIYILTLQIGKNHKFFKFTIL